MTVGYLTVYATDCGEILEDARAQAKQDIDRIVNKEDDVSLSWIKARYFTQDPDLSDEDTILRLQRAKMRHDIVRTLNLPVTNFL